MHSKIFIAKFSNETISVEDLKDQAYSLIDDFPYEGSSIDYIQTMEGLASMGEDSNTGEYYRKLFVCGVVERLCKEYYAHKVSEDTVRFTKQTMQKYYSRNMDEILNYIKGFKKKVYEKSTGVWKFLRLFGFRPKWHWEYDTYGFVKNSYHLECLFNDEHPKWFSNYTYLYGESDFIKSIYRKMMFDKVDEIELQIVDVLDYHF